MDVSVQASVSSPMRNLGQISQGMPIVSAANGCGSPTSEPRNSFDRGIQITYAHCASPRGSQQNAVRDQSMRWAVMGLASCDSPTAGAGAGAGNRQSTEPGLMGWYPRDQQKLFTGGSGLLTDFDQSSSVSASFGSAHPCMPTHKFAAAYPLIRDQLIDCPGSSPLDRISQYLTCIYLSENCMKEYMLNLCHLRHPHVCCMLW